MKKLHIFVILRYQNIGMTLFFFWFPINILYNGTYNFIILIQNPINNVNYLVICYCKIWLAVISRKSRCAK